MIKMRIFGEGRARSSDGCPLTGDPPLRECWIRPTGRTHSGEWLLSGQVDHGHRCAIPAGCGRRWTYDGALFTKKRRAVLFFWEANSRRCWRGRRPFSKAGCLSSNAVWHEGGKRAIPWRCSHFHLTPEGLVEHREFRPFDRQQLWGGFS